MRRWVVACVLASAGSATTRVSPATAQELTSLHVCNEGPDTVFALTATTGGEHRTEVLGWLDIPPNDCNNVYANTVPHVDPGYIGFAVRGPSGRLISVSANVPQYGTDAKGRPTFVREVQAFCMLPYPDHASLFTSDREDDASHCSDFVNKKIADRERNRYAAYESTLLFRPKLDCSVLGSCGPGSYYLDLRHAPGASTVSLAKGLSPEQQGLKLIGQFLVALGKAARESEIAKQNAELQTLRDRFARYKPGSSAPWAEQWANAPHVSPADYDSTQMGGTAVVSGTIARYSVDTRRFPHWITIYFQESTNDGFVVCSPYPDMFQEVVGLNLNALIGRRLEVVGPIEQASCPVAKPAGSVRVLESGMFHLR